MKNHRFFQRDKVFNFRLIVLPALITLLLFLNSIAAVSQEDMRIMQYGLDEGLSQVTILDLVKDGNGFVWGATQDGLNRFDGSKFKNFKYDEKDSTSISGNLTNKLLIDDSGKIWIGTVGNGLNYYDSKMDIFHRISLESSNDKSEIISDLTKGANGTIWVASRISGLHQLEPTDDFSFQQNNFLDDKVLTALSNDGNNLWVGQLDGSIYKIPLISTNISEDFKEFNVQGQVLAFYHAGNKLLIGTDFGFYSYDLKGKFLELIELEQSGKFLTKHVWDFLEEDDSSVWIATGNGLYLFNWVTGKVVKTIKPSKGLEKGLSASTVQALLRVSDNQIIVGTTNSLNVIDFKEPYFKNISKNKKGKHFLNDNLVFSVLKDNIDLWVGTTDGGLNLIRDGKPYYYLEDLSSKNSIAGSVVRTILKDEINNCLWLATTRGLGKLDLEEFNPDNPKFTIYNHDSHDENSINDDFLKDITLDNNNNLWGATFGKGIFRMEIDVFENVSFHRYANNKDNSNSLQNDFVSCIRVDRENNIYVGTQGGLTMLKFKNLNYKNPSFSNYFKDNTSSKSLSHNSIYDILIDKNDSIWLGTKHGLNLFLGNNKFESWTESKQFPNVAVYSIQNDDKGDLWLGTNDGLVNFNPKKRTFTHYGVSDGIQSREFDIHAKFKDEDGLVYMGGIAGLTYFSPEDLKEIDTPQQLYFSKLQVKGETIRVAKNAKSILKKSLEHSKELRFRHNQFPFYLHFSSIDYRFDKQVEYGFKLLPNDEEWNMLKDPEIQFLNLPSGKHTLLINGFSRGVEWNQEPLKMDLNILPPWWATWWAYTLYLILALTLIYIFYRFKVSRKLAYAESKRLKEINQLKNSLYTNITHEFRTPLTVILGMIDMIKERTELENDSIILKPVSLIERNSNNLLQLVNEMLDLAKIESGAMELQPIKADVVPFVKYICESFQSYAKELDLNLVVYSEIEYLEMDFDEHKLQAIVSNLLSNAIKFSKPYGKIIVHLNCNEIDNLQYLQIKVKDEGIGIDVNEQSHIFNRFYQADATITRKGEGTGVGLSLTKNFIELMNGTIDVKSEIGLGSEFLVKLPITKNAKPADLEFQKVVKPIATVQTKEKLVPISNNDNLPIALLIEDNLDVAYFLQDSLSIKYKALHAENGEIGVEMAIQYIPDIIICDVMMPKMDGYEVCKTLKSDKRTDHIPIIMLTAKVTKKDRLAGLSYGADAYLPKPFEKAELFTRLNQLILVRKKMAAKFQEDKLSNFLKIQAEHPSEKFIQEAVKIIHKEIANSNFGPKQLAFKLHLSESQTYRKLKSISGKSTAVFIRSIRLQRAKEILHSSRKNISEVAYEVGFNDPSWFSRAFKEEFGYSPSASYK